MSPHYFVKCRTCSSDWRHIETRNTFCGTWYLPHSRVHKSMTSAAILDLLNFKFLTVGMVKRVELHHRAKFSQNRSSRGRDMAFFDFSKWRPVVLCGNLNVRQATSQQVFKSDHLLGFYMDTRFQSFSPMINRIVCHALLNYVAAASPQLVRMVDWYSIHTLLLPFIVP